MTHADELLAQARASYWRGREHYRDAMLETGRLLHDYLRKYLEGADGLSEDKRLALKITRATGIHAAAKALETTTTNINRLIAVSRTVDLLSDGGNVGTLAWGTIAQFWRFVHRKNATRKEWKDRSEHVPGRKGVPVSLLETWEVDGRFGEKAIHLFRRAVLEGLEYETVRPAVLHLYSREEAPRPGRRRREGKPETKASQSLGAVASVASVGDLAETLFEIVSKAEDPLAVVERLLSMVRAQCRSPRPSFAGGAGAGGAAAQARGRRHGEREHQ